MRIQQCGPSLFYVDLELSDFTGRGRRTRTVVDQLLGAWPDARITAASGTLLVEGPMTQAQMQPRLQSALATDSAITRARHHVINARYNGADLAWVAEVTGLSPQQVVGRHAGRSYDVELLGFMPGFAYLTGLDEKLVLPRRASPRPRVDAFSVAIAGAMTGIYPGVSSGGWHLLAHAVGVKLFDPTRQPACLFAPGDRVEFVPTSEENVPELTRPAALNHVHPVLCAAQVVGCVTVQDHGRPHLLSQGIASAGAMDPWALDAANRSVGNSRDAAALEIFHGGITLSVLNACVVSVNGGPARALKTGDTLRLTPHQGALQYVALQGGMDVPVVMGSRATLLGARLGGVLQKGDTLGCGTLCDNGWNPDPVHPQAALRVWRGPHPTRFPDGAWESLLKQTWRVSPALDRVGMRLAGQPIGRRGNDTALPEPMMRGAIQVTPDGTPIVLGVDAPATGGYPVIGFVEPASLAQLAHRRPGDKVEFRGA